VKEIMTPLTRTFWVHNFLREKKNLRGMGWMRVQATLEKMRGREFWEFIIDEEYEGGLDIPNP